MSDIHLSLGNMPPSPQTHGVVGRSLPGAESHWLLTSESTRPASTTSRSGESTPITVKHQGREASLSSRRLEPCPGHHSEHLMRACRLLFPNCSIYVCLLSSGTRASKQQLHTSFVSPQCPEQGQYSLIDVRSTGFKCQASCKPSLAADQAHDLPELWGK